jgi:energy-coupling factor transporter ATP-binding protein EcfA2
MFKSDDCILIMGQRGCGKSHLARNLQKMYPRKIILDTLADYSEGEIVHSFSEFADALTRHHSSGDDFTLIYKFHPESEASVEEFDEIMRLSYYFGNVQVVIEEVHNFSSPHVLPHWLKQCLLTGRHQNVSLMITTQRPGELNKTILSQCAHIFCGKLVEGNDLRYISAFLGTDAKRLVSLPNRQFLYFSENGVQQISNDF